MSLDLVDLEALFVVAVVAGMSLLAWRWMVAEGHRRAHRNTAELLKANPPAGGLGHARGERDVRAASGTHEPVPDAAEREPASLSPEADVEA
ncbi:MAG: hypothetical protein AAGH15_18845 [Myxococcota bacterium]